MARHLQKYGQYLEQGISVESSVVHKRYKLVDLLRQCDFELTESPEIVIWRDAPAVGVEVVAQAARALALKSN